MPTPASQLSIANLDYDQILENLITFMKADPTFSDYDFTGSGLHLLARVLSYVTFYNNYYLSAAVNESFLDTAQLRSSVVSHARMLGYYAHGRTSATYTANVSLIMSQNLATTVTLPRNSRFELTTNTDIVFVNPSSVTLRPSTANTFIYEASNVELIEGVPSTYRFVVDTNNPTQRFIIPSANVDFKHFSVVVQDSTTNLTQTVFKPATSHLTPTKNDPIYFVQEAYNGYPEFKFGNGIVGRPLSHGNIITVEYYVSRGADGNDVRGPFRLVGATVRNLVRGTTASPSADTQASNGGSDAEDIDTVRYIAPLVYSAQNRCVTAEDYKTAILAQYSNEIAAINVFGGEQGNPFDAQERPVFGKVFIAIKPKVGRVLSDKTEQDILQYAVRPKNVVGVIPEIIDPEYIHVLVRSRVVYDTTLTSQRRGELATAVINSIANYNTQFLEKFDSTFRFSKLSRVIDDTDPAILSSQTRVLLQQRIFPVLNGSNALVVKFGVPLARVGETSVILPEKSHRFAYYNASGKLFSVCQFVETNGLVQVHSIEQATKYTYVATLSNGKKVDELSVVVNAGQTLTPQEQTNIIQTLKSRNPSTYVNPTPIIATIERGVIVDNNVGSFNLQTGTLTLSNFVPARIENNEPDIWITVTPAQFDFTPKLNRVYTIDASSAIVEMVEHTVNTESAFFQGGTLR